MTISEINNNNKIHWKFVIYIYIFCFCFCFYYILMIVDIDGVEATLNEM